MQIPIITALNIRQHNDVRCEPCYYKDTGKWSGEIRLYYNNPLNKTLVSSEPVFKSSKDAVEWAKDTLQDIRNMKIVL